MQDDATENAKRLQALSREGGLVLLYHGVWAQPPAALAGGLHNVTPTQMAEQLEAVRREFEIVSVDEFAQAKSKKGLAAVSFDDGYRCVIEQGLPVFESLGIPFTIYINGTSVSGQTFWRDKVRLIVERDLTKEFEAEMRDISITGKGKFYRYTKDPINNSRHVVAELDRFLDDRNLSQEIKAEHQYCFDSTDWLISHPLVSYGNHSHSHYVMSSLTRAEQTQEIQATQSLLEGVSGINTSQVFSIPFGEERDFNEATVVAARECGYSALLLSRGRAHTEDVDLFGMAALDRLMPRQSHPGAGVSGILAGLRS